MSRLSKVSVQATSRLMNGIMAGITIVMAAGAIVATFACEDPLAMMPFAFVGVLTGGIGWMLRRLDVTVDADEAAVLAQFGPLVRRRYAFEDIQGVSVVRYPWYLGWGIRYGWGVTALSLPGFRDALELRLKSGWFSRVLLTIPQADEVCEALRAHLATIDPKAASATPSAAEEVSPPHVAAEAGTPPRDLFSSLHALQPLRSLSPNRRR